MSDKNSTNFEDKYKNLSEIDHVLERPGLYLGNVHTYITPYNLFVPSKNHILKLDNVGLNEGVLKCFDEILTNSIDERIKSDRLFNITKIDVDINSDGTIVVQDDGGIPVVYHKGQDCYIPEMIFGRFRTSSNYTNNREGSGLNGLGAKLTNIMSEYFLVETADGKNDFAIKWSNNMKEIGQYAIKATKKNYTRIEFKLDLKRFNMTTLDNNMIRVLQKRVIDGAAISPGLVINFTSNVLEGKLNSTWTFNNFIDYVGLHVEDLSIKAEMRGWKSADNKHEVVIMPSIGYNFGLLNGAACSEGTHIRKIELQFIKKMLLDLKAKDIELITEKDILSKTTIFMRTNIINPDFDSQSKDKLASKIPSNILNLSGDYINSFKDCEIFKQLMDYYNTKYKAELQKNLRKLNANLKKVKSKKLIGCNTTFSELAELFLFEGTSASNGFEYARDTKYQACYLLRGKVKNTLDLTAEKALENQEFREIIAASGLQFNSPKHNLKNCNYGKFIFATDADYDGYHITGLLITFFAKFFPELFIDGRIFRLIAPIGVAIKGKETLYYYTYEDYDNAQLQLKGKGYSFGYKKGLGALEDDQYVELIKNKRLEKIILEKDYMVAINDWFSKSTEIRKNILTKEAGADDEQ